MNEILHRAQKTKNDEFYTQYSDIEKEMLLHKEHFKNKIVYCPCDDYEKSQFVKFFLNNYDDFELKGLIATSYAYAGDVERDLFNSEVKRGKVLVKTFDEVYYGLLEGTGDFRSAECTAFRDRADIIATNPPFSLFREFFSWAKDKDLELVAPLNCVTYSVCFPFFKSRKVKLGDELDFFISPEGNLEHNGASYWVSTFGYDIPPLELTKSYSPKEYPKYDNYDAINVNKVVDIPKDYKGIMGVPMTFLKKWDPCQFEVVSATRGDGTNSVYINGKEPFARLLIRRKKILKEP